MNEPIRFESWVDRQIREAMERGEFDNLPGAGRPVELDDDPDWWIKAKIRRENLEPVLPTVMTLRREVERIQQTLSGVRSEAAARAVCDDLNARIRDFYAAAVDRPRFVVRLLDVDAEVRLWAQGAGS